MGSRVVLTFDEGTWYLAPACTGRAPWAVEVFWLSNTRDDTMKPMAKPKVGSFQAMALSQELFRGVRREIYIKLSLAIAVVLQLLLRSSCVDLRQCQW